MDRAAPENPATLGRSAHGAGSTGARPDVQRRRVRRNLVHLALDILTGLATVLLISFNFTGLLFHEWLGLGLIPALIVHLLLNWDWVAASTRRFFGRLAGTVRISYVLNVALFVAMTIVILSGVLISEAAVPQFAAGGTSRGFWHTLHTGASNATLIIFGLHVALHWRWIVNTVRQALPGARRRGRVGAAQPGTAATGSALAGGAGDGEEGAR